MNANLTHSPSRRRPSLFLGCRAPSGASEPHAAALPARPVRRSSVPPPGVDLRLPHPAAQRGLGEIEFPRHRRHGLAALPDQPHRLRLELVRENARRLRLAMTHSYRTFVRSGVSTKPGQVHPSSLSWLRGLDLNQRSLVMSLGDKGSL